MTAAEFTDFTARRCGASKVSSAGWASQPPTKPWGKSNGKTGFVSQIVIAPFNRPPVGDLTEIRHHQQELLRKKVGLVRDFTVSYLIKTAEGSGKPSSHFHLIEVEIFDLAIALPWGAPELFACIACRSYEQAAQKADEFRRNDPDKHWAVVIKSFNLIYTEFCEQEDEQPIDRQDAEDSTLSSYIAEIKMRQRKAFDLLETYRTTFWAKYKFFGGATTLFTTHASIQSWNESHFTRLWCPSSDNLRQIAALFSGGRGSSDV
jgi:hypothetical protein